MALVFCSCLSSLSPSALFASLLFLWCLSFFTHRLLSISTLTVLSSSLPYCCYHSALPLLSVSALFYNYLSCFFINCITDDVFTFLHSPFCLCLLPLCSAIPLSLSLSLPFFVSFLMYLFISFSLLSVSTVSHYLHFWPQHLPIPLPYICLISLPSLYLFTNFNRTVVSLTPVFHFLALRSPLTQSFCYVCLSVYLFICYPPIHRSISISVNVYPFASLFHILYRLSLYIFYRLLSERMHFGWSCKYPDWM